MSGKRSRTTISDPEQAPPSALQELYDAKSAWHCRQARLPLKEKVRILLELQRQDLPLLLLHRSLKSWERPWEIEP